MPSTDPFTVAVIIASTRHGRFGPTVANWFVRRSTEHSDLDVDTVDLAEFALPATFTADPTPTEADATRALGDRLAAADAFVVVTPEYNHSFPAPLKNAIDHYNRPWQAKPVGFVSYGGISGGLRAVEQLRLVFAEMHAVTVRETVSFAGAGLHFDADGELREPVGAEAAAKKLLDQLTWWAKALRDATRDHPYAA